MKRRSPPRHPVSLFRQIMVLGVMAPLAVSPPHVLALPTGGEIVAGEVAMAGGAGMLDLTQASQAAIVNWADFSIGVGEIVNIHQLGADAVMLNRVLGANPSALLGQLNANGRVLLINPNGVVVGRDGSVNAMEFIASALDVADTDFIDGGELAFAGESTAGVLNLGSITATNGDVVLVAYQVSNAGTIAAPQGVAALAAGQEVMLSPEGDQRILVKTTLGPVPVALGVDNSGVIAATQAELKAAGGNLYELAINQSGYVRATGVAEVDGRVLLTAEAGAIEVNGTLAAHNADGSGGEVLVGGDYRGANSAVANALTTRVGADAVIDVAATAATASGGRAIVWADQQTDFAGRIDGRAGAQGGDGAFAEVSGKFLLNYTGLADLTATQGATGTLLLDPAEAIVSDAADDQANGLFNTTVLENNLATANVTIEASTYSNSTDTYGDITVNDAVAWTSGNTLLLKAGDNITVNADLNGGSTGTVDFALGSNSGFTPMTGKLTVQADAAVTAGTVVIRANPDADPAFAGNGIPDRPIGEVAFHGILNTATLDISLNEDGVQGDVIIANAANAIGTLTTSDATPAAIADGSVRIVDGSGDLTVSGTLQVDGDHTIEITTAGDLTLATGSSVGADGGDIILASTGGSFINQAGGAAIAHSFSGRTLIYSGNPADTVLDGLALTPVYNKTRAGNAPSSITQTGNRVLYRLAPTITFKADDLARFYGATNPTLTFTATGLVGGDTAAQAFSGTPNLATTALASGDVGTAAITIAAGSVTASDYDYQIAFVPGTLTINPAPLTITATDQSRSFGVANPTFTAGFSGLVNGDTAADVAGLTLGTSATIDSPDGTYAIVAAGATDANYAITFVNGLLTIGASTVTIRAADFTRYFGDANPTFTGNVSAPTGFDLGLITGLTYTSVATPNSAVGTYAIVPSTDALSGVSFNLVNGTLRVDPRLLTITGGSYARLYGSANPALGGTLSGLASFHTANDIVGLDYTTSAGTDAGIGNYAVTPTTGANPNYAITIVPGSLVVNPAPLTITAEAAAKLYADLDPTFSADASGLVLDQSLAEVGMVQLTTGTGQFSPAGAYTITPSFVSSTGLAANYAVSFVPGTFTINPRPLTIAAFDASRSYGEANPTFEYNSIGTNPPGITNASLGAFDGIAISTTATATSAAGTYGLTPGGGTNANYAYTYVPGTLTVNPALLTITARDAARTYGDANPTFTSTVNGLKLADTLAEVLGDATLATAATATSGVGTYAITPTGTALSSNYTISFEPGTLTVNKAPLFIAPALSSRLYGAADPDFAIAATGLRNSDTTAVLSNLRFQSVPSFVGVGSHMISVLSATALNYELTFGTGVMNVLRRPLTITADSFTREYGEANPAFTVTFDNLASFDSAATITGLSFTSPATRSSHVLAGGYGINVTSAANANYTITYVPGKLDITPAPLLFDVGNVTRVYGDANPAPTASLATGLKLDDTLDDLGLQFVSPATTSSDVGTYFYGATTANPNYTVTVNGGQLIVTPAPLTVTIYTLSRSYGDDNPEPTFTLGGLKFEADRAGAVQVLNPTTFATDVGQYAFTGTVRDPNYTLTALRGDIFVTPRRLDVVATGSRVFGDANPDASSFAIVTDLVNGDQVAEVLSLRYLTSLDSGVDVGTYDLSADTQVSLLSSNYVINSVSSSLVVNPRPIYVEIAPVERLYGDVNPSFTLVGDTNIQPAFNTADEVLSFIAPDARAVPGNYTVEAEIINANYTIGTLGFGNLTINPRRLTVVIDNVARYYGDANPSFTATLGGDGLPDFVDPAAFLDLHTIAPTDETSGAGHYLISSLVSAIDTSLYHLQAFTPGILSIFPRPVTLDLGDALFAVSPGTVLDEVVDFSEVNFSVSGRNFANGQSAASQFPDLVYVVSATPGGTPVGVAVDLNHAPVPTLAEFFNGTAPLADVEVDDVLVAEYVAPVTAAADGGESEIVPVDVVAVELGSSDGEIQIDPSREIFVPTTEVGAGETRVTRAISLSGGYLNTNPNYVVTAVNNGVLTMRNRTRIEEQIKIATDSLKQDQTIVVRGFSDYRANIGVLFSDFPELSTDIVTRYLDGLFTTGGMTSDDLYVAIFGEGALVTPPFDPAVIGAWLSDISTNAEKRSTMALALLGYLKDLQGKDASAYTDAERFLVTTVTGKVQADREAFANTLRARELAFEEMPNASRAYYGAREALTVIEKRAAVAATGFLDFERANMTADEIRVAESIQASVLDADSTSTMALIEEWFAVRGSRRGSAFIDEQFAGMLTEMGEVKGRADAARADLDAGTESPIGPAEGLQGAHDFVNMEPPYGEFLKETAIAELEAKMARYDLADLVGGATAAGAGVASGAAAAGGVTAAGTALSGAIIPYVSTSTGVVMTTAAAAGSTSASATTAAGSTVFTVATGAAVFVTAAVAVAIAGTITLVQQQEQKTIYEGIMEQGFGPVTLADINFSPVSGGAGADPRPEDVPDQIMQTLLVQSLEAMLLGN